MKEEMGKLVFLMEQLRDDFLKCEEFILNNIEPLIDSRKWVIIINDITNHKEELEKYLTLNVGKLRLKKTLDLQLLRYLVDIKITNGVINTPINNIIKVLNSTIKLIKQYK